MRTWGRTFNEDGTWQWVEVSTDANGFNDAVWITTLIQCLLLNLGESPFYGNYGIPAQQSVVQQVAPDFYVAQTQAQFSQYFANLVVSNVTPVPSQTNPNPQPTYKISLITNQGVPFQTVIAGNDQFQ